jgi:ABC-type oligopeptide transport system substrate-binding subunit
MIRSFLPFCAAGLVLTGCAATQGSTQTAASAEGPVVQGYLYHDSNHPDGFNPSLPPPHYDTSHGTWLWPPAVSDKPN